MPYPNEHTAVLQDSSKYAPDSFRRTKGGTIYGKIKVPTTIGILWAKLKGKSKPADHIFPVSLRFPTKSWTVQKAKTWLKKNNVKYQRFEPAKAKEKQTMANSKTKAPVQACIFNERNEVQFADGGSESNGFKILGYTGKIMKNHWYWGNVAFDLSGLKFYKSRLAVLEEHFKQDRIGFTTKQEIKDQVIIEGQFLDSEKAQQLKKDIKAGFPMEASVLCLPSVIERIMEGASTKVNRHILKGPGSVFREAVIKEVSMCVFGLDTNTKSVALAAGPNQEVKFNLLETNIMAEEHTIESVEEFAAKYPGFYSDILASGVATGAVDGKLEVQASFAALQEACGDDKELLVQCFTENKTPTEAAKLRAEKLGKENSELTTKVTELQKEKPAVEAAQTEFSDQATPPAGGDQIEAGSATDEAWKKEFAASKELQVEFGNDVESYIAFKQADANDQVR